MLRNEAISIIKQLLGFRTDQDANIATNLQLVQTQLEIGPVKPWFLLSEESTIRTTASEARIPLPTDLLEEFEDGALEYVPDDSTLEPVLLIKDDFDLLKKDFANVDPAEPSHYAVVGNYFRIFPLPDDDYLLRMLYYKRDTVLSSNVENEWLKWVPYLLIGQAGMLSATGLRDKTAYAQFKSMASDGLLLLNTQNESRMHSNRIYQIGGEH